MSVALGAISKLECASHLEANRLSQETLIARILGASTPKEHAQHYRELVGFPATDSSQLLSVLERKVASGNGLVLSFSHDHYLTVSGGTQTLVGLEQVGFNRLGWNYLHLCPFQPLPILAEMTSPYRFDVLASLDGETVGSLPLAGVIKALSALSVQSGRRVAMVHHLLGHCPELVTSVVEAMGTAEPYFWIHDLFAHCPSVHLLRNHVSYCGGPPPDSSACAICHAGAERPTHLERMSQFFSKLRPKVLAPSQTILDQWCRLGNFDYSDAAIIPLCHLVPGEPVRVANGPLVVGFLGTAAFEKGWDVFAALALWFRDDPRYRFVQLGYFAEQLPGVTFHQVKVTQQDRDAMVRCVADCGVEVSISWSRCFESFSFTSMEAIAGGAFLLARSGAGNVPALIRGFYPSLGLTVATLTELQALFASGDIIALARKAPRRRGSLHRGDGAATMVVSQ